MSNLPLPDLLIDNLTTWDAPRQGLEDEPDPRGYQDMQTALRATMGRQVRGTRLSAAGLVTDLPLDFPTLGAAERFRRGRTPAAMKGLVHRIAAANDWPSAMWN